METPSSSSRRITRSQARTLTSNNTMPISSRKNDKTDDLNSRQRINGGKQERERSVLFDITNDSPIVGLAMGSLKTPSSTYSKKRMIIQNSQSKHDTTPGSGEDLLRDQVKTLLQKVEEEAVVPKFSFHPSHKHGGFVNSPLPILAPTPANTPQLSDFSANTTTNASQSLNVSPVAEKINLEMVNEQEESDEPEVNVVTRSLFMDFSEKFEGSDSDDDSVWSVEVNVSTSDECEEDKELEDYYKEEEDDNGGVDELCEEMSKASVSCAKFTGKHTRFVYNSDGELEGEESDCH